MSEWVVKNLDEVVEYFIDYRGKHLLKQVQAYHLSRPKLSKMDVYKHLLNLFRSRITHYG